MPLAAAPDQAVGAQPVEPARVEQPLSPTQPREYLEVVAGPAAGARVPIAEQLALGSSGEGMAALGGDSGLSRWHAKIAHGEDGRLYVADLNSAEGTWVNGARISGPVWLSPGDEVRVGNSTLRVRAPAQAAAPAAAAPPTEPAAPAAPAARAWNRRRLGVFAGLGAAVIAVIAVIIALASGGGSSKHGPTTNTSAVRGTSTLAQYRAQIQPPLNAWNTANNAFRASAGYSFNGTNFDAVASAHAAISAAATSYAHRIAAVTPPPSVATAAKNFIASMHAFAISQQKVSQVAKTHDVAVINAAILAGDRVAKAAAAAGTALYAAARPPTNSSSSSSASSSTTTSASASCSGRSPYSGRHAFTAFFNTTNQPASVYWLTHTGMRVLWVTVAPHVLEPLRSYVGYRWAIYQSGKCIAATVTTPGFHTFAIH
jgi:hypothetical protein